MSSELSADDICRLLQLEPNATCGFVRVTFVSEQSLGSGAAGCGVAMSSTGSTRYAAGGLLEPCVGRHLSL